MDDLLFDAWRTINDDPEIWCAVLSAEGEKGFCIGGDVSDGAERKSRMALAGGLTGIGGPLVTLKNPLLASVQGFCVGGGLGLPLCADIIVAVRTAQFGLDRQNVAVGQSGFVR